MKPHIVAGALLVMLPIAGAVGAAEAPAAEGKAEAPKRHPLRGVVTRVDAERSALMVKHEEIPGVMRAMTMMFKVNAPALKAVKSGDAITGQMSRQGSNWVLEDVKVVDAPKS